MQETTTGKGHQMNKPRKAWGMRAAWTGLVLLLFARVGAGTASNATTPAGQSQILFDDVLVIVVLAVAIFLTWRHNRIENRRRDA